MILHGGTAFFSGWFFFFFFVRSSMSIILSLYLKIASGHSCTACKATNLQIPFFLDLHGVFTKKFFKNLSFLPSFSLFLPVFPSLSLFSSDENAVLKDVHFITHQVSSVFSKTERHRDSCCWDSWSGKQDQDLIVQASVSNQTLQDSSHCWVSALLPWCK